MRQIISLKFINSIGGILFIIYTLCLIYVLIDVTSPFRNPTTFNVSTLKPPSKETSKLRNSESVDYAKAFVRKYFPKLYGTSNPKVLIITHLSANLFHKIPGEVPVYTFTFTCMLYASWKYVFENYDWAKNPKQSMKVDLLVYYSDKLSGDDLPDDCVRLTRPVDLLLSPFCGCFKRPIPEGKFTYSTLNQFSFLKDVNLQHIVSSYDYVMRTDPDTFLTPNFFNWKIPETTEILFGMGGYSTLFNLKLLDKIATQDLGWKRQGFTNIGSTWIVKPSKFVELCEKAAFATFFLHENGRNVTKYPEIIPYMDKTPGKGTWPHWWRPVSSMYGADLAIQHLFPDLTDVNHQKLLLDAHSSDLRSISETKHIHAFHTTTKFHKFLFYVTLGSFCKDGKLVEPYEVLKPLKLLGQFDSAMMIPDYAGNISLHGTVEYFKKNGCF